MENGTGKERCVREAPRRYYDRLILDVINGNQSHFVRNDELEAAWAVCDPLVSAIESGYLPMTTYSYGSRGPKRGRRVENESWAFTVAFGREGFGAAVERGIRYVAGRGGRHDGIFSE